MGRSIIWFRQDLRLHDNEALTEALRNADELIPVYIFEPAARPVHASRARFLLESVQDLRKNLRAYGSDLIVRTGKADEILYHLALETQSQWVYCNRERTRDEVRVQDRLEQKLWTIGRELRYARGKMLYYTSDLPFPVTHCPDSFATFRKEVEHVIPVRDPLDRPADIPPMSNDLRPGDFPDVEDLSTTPGSRDVPLFVGGESAGVQALKALLDHGTMTAELPEALALSPWISMGCLSPKKVYHDSFLLGSSGERIRQHLVYRDYLRLMGKKYGDKIFYRSGIQGLSLPSYADSPALWQWQEGQTGVEIIDAAMHQLNCTGWMPDALRRLCAHYLVKVLRLDWRLGAAYFESRLIDYDPCSNWVSWQNIAGIGPDTREERVIHFENAGRKLDPYGKYVALWLYHRRNYYFPLHAQESRT